MLDFITVTLRDSRGEVATLDYGHRIPSADLLRIKGRKYGATSATINQGRVENGRLNVTPVRTIAL